MIAPLKQMGGMRRMHHEGTKTVSANPAQWRRSFRAAGGCLLLWLLLDLPLRPGSGQTAPTRAQGRRAHFGGPSLSLSPEEADTALPVRLRGMVTLYLPDLSLFFVQDPTGGIYVFDNSARPNLRRGQWVEVEGVTGRGRVTPVLLTPRVRVLSSNEFAAPIISPGRLPGTSSRASRCDAQWVQLKAQFDKLSGGTVAWH